MKRAAAPDTNMEITKPTGWLKRNQKNLIRGTIIIGLVGIAFLLIKKYK